MDRYELVDGTSRKFWEVAVRGKSVIVHWGRIGATGVTKTHTLATADEAIKHCDSLVREKTRKGYRLRRATAAHGKASKRSAQALASNTGTAVKARKAGEPGPRGRLRAVFAALNARGIVALENAGYTQSDGWDDVNEIATGLAGRGKRPRGAVFYHGQDVQRGKRGEGLHLTFGSYAARRTDADSIAVGRIVVELLEANGFRPKWDGTSTTRIHTGRFEWR